MEGEKIESHENIENKEKNSNEHKKETDNKNRKYEYCTLVKTAARVTQLLCYRHRSRIMAGILVCGYDRVNGGQVYTIPLGGSLIAQDYALGGSGSSYLYAWVGEHYKKGMTKEQAVGFAHHAVAHAIARDGSSGGVVRSVVMEEAGVSYQTVPFSALPYRIENDPGYGKMAVQNPPWSSKSEEKGNRMVSTEEVV